MRGEKLMSKILTGMILAAMGVTIDLFAFIIFIVIKKNKQETKVTREIFWVSMVVATILVALAAIFLYIA